MKQNKDRKPNGYWNKERCQEEALKYETRIEFQTKSNSAYSSALKNNWMDEICSHMISKQKPRGYWTKEKCQEEALKYETKIEFYKKSSSVYNIAYAKKWLTEICSHMVLKNNKPNGYWTYEKCKEAASNCKSRQDFENNYKSAYHASHKNNWMDDFFDINTNKPSGYWTKENCIKEAQKYNIKIDFYNNSKRAYDVCWKNNWLDDACSHMIQKRKPKGFWTYETCKEEASKYETRSDFYEKSSGAYYTATNNEWLYEICLHMKLLHKPNGYWTYENCKKEASKYTKKVDFLKNSPSAHSISSKNGWIDDICSHMIICGNKYLRFIYIFEFEDNHAYIGLTYNVEYRELWHTTNEKSQVYKHIKKTGSKYNLIKIIDKPISTEEAQELEHETKLKYIEKGWTILNKGKTGKGSGSLGGNTIKWTYEICKEESLKYESKAEFSKNSNGAYCACQRNGWMEEFCSHMISKQKPSGYWTKERCHEEALKYETRNEFHKNSKSSYASSQRNGWMDDFFPPKTK